MITLLVSTANLVDITEEASLHEAQTNIEREYGGIDILINNAANNPAVGKGISSGNFSKLEMFSIDVWNKDIHVGLTGAFLCIKCFGAAMARRDRGSIINIFSDLDIIAPNQGLYKKTTFRTIDKK